LIFQNLSNSFPYSFVAIGGATVNHKTDIWYSYLEKENFEKWDEDNAALVEDEDEDGNQSWRPKVSKDGAFSPPVRITDNAACKMEYNVTEGVWEDRGGPYCKEICDYDIPDDPFEIEPNPPNKIMVTCVTKDGGLLLDGKTGASRVNMFLLPENGSVVVVMGYEESKGLGWEGDKAEGHRRLNDSTDAPTNSTDPPKGEDEGKNIFYHTFDYKSPQKISHGTMLNLPEMDTNGMPLMSEDGSEFLTKNARRVRFIVQVSAVRCELQTELELKNSEINFVFLCPAIK